MKDDNNKEKPLPLVVGTVRSVEDEIKDLELRLGKLEAWASIAGEILTVLLTKLNNSELLVLAAKMRLTLEGESQANIQKEMFEAGKKALEKGHE